MKHVSISSPSVQHDEANIITEIILLNKYGTLPEFCWRKGKIFHEEWSRIVVVVKNVIQKLKIKPGQLIWYVNKFKIADIDYHEFGLLKFRVSKIFPSISIGEIVETYRKLNALKQSRLNQIETVNTSQVYETKQEQPKKSLMDILRELNG